MLPGKALEPSTKGATMSGEPTQLTVTLTDAEEPAWLDDELPPDPDDDGVWYVGD